MIGFLSYIQSHFSNLQNNRIFHLVRTTKMGRQRMNIIPLKERERQTFRARSQGLIKKAMELSILTESKISLIILDEKTGNVTEYNSAESLIENVPQAPSLMKLYTKEDVSCCRLRNG
jgi:hypothetical protein